MAWAELEYTRQEINGAGALFRPSAYVSEDTVRAINIIDNFRVAHAYPLNTLQTNLRARVRPIKGNIIAQRLKRMPSILAKLYRFPTMQLWDMQDIGGCRAIVPDLNDVQQLVNTYKSSKSRMRRKLAGEKNYIQNPRDSGYRGRHLIYRYISDSNEIYNGLKIEIQLRTNLQHAWATAVETVDAFTQQALKSSKGKPDWERFFQLMGTEMAFREGTPPVQNTPANREELRSELRQCANELQVEKNFEAFTAAIGRTRRPSIKASDYILLSLDANKKRLNVDVYPRKYLSQAVIEYSKKEQKILDNKEGNAVLVSVDSFNHLKRAYPNYFADTRLFIKILKDSIKKRGRFWIFQWIKLA